LRYLLTLLYFCRSRPPYRSELVLERKVRAPKGSIAANGRRSEVHSG